MEHENLSSKQIFPNLSSKIRFQGHVQNADRLRIVIPNLIAKNKSDQTSSFTIAGKSLKNERPTVFHISKMKEPIEKMPNLNQIGSPLLETGLSSMTKRTNVRSNSPVLRSKLIHGLNSMHQNEIIDVSDREKPQE